eukprot:7107888-Pyramimonas_sp.AAC.1
MDPLRDSYTPGHLDRVLLPTVTLPHDGAVHTCFHAGEQRIMEAREGIIVVRVVVVVVVVIKESVV